MPKVMNYRRGVIFDLSIPEHVMEVLMRANVLTSVTIGLWSRSDPRASVSYKTSSPSILGQLMLPEATHAICYYEDDDPELCHLYVAIIDDFDKFLEKGGPFEDEEPQTYVRFKSHQYDAVKVRDVCLEQGFSSLWCAAAPCWKVVDVNEDTVTYTVTILPRCVGDDGRCDLREVAKQPEVPEVLGDIPEE